MYDVIFIALVTVFCVAAFVVLKFWKHWYDSPEFINVDQERERRAAVLRAEQDVRQQIDRQHLGAIAHAGDSRKVTP